MFLGPDEKPDGVGLDCLASFIPLWVETKIKAFLGDTMMEITHRCSPCFRDDNNTKMAEKNVSVTPEGLKKQNKKISGNVLWENFLSDSIVLKWA